MRIPKLRLPLCALAVLAAGLVAAPGGAQPAALGTPVAWGCGGYNHGQCTVPAGLTRVTALAGGLTHSLALKDDGTVVAMGCGVATTSDSATCLPASPA